MTTMTHIFFGLHGTLIDAERAQNCHAEALGHVMAARYGGNPTDWTAAQRTIQADWDSYYADLNLDGDEGLDALWEGMFRTTRALFRLTNTPEPPYDELKDLSRALYGQSVQICDTCYPDVPDVVRRFNVADYVLGVITRLPHDGAASLLAGCNVRAHFKGPVIGPDATGQFAIDETFLTKAAGQAGAHPEACLMVESSLSIVAAAKAIGMQAIHITRDVETTPDETIHTLTELADRVLR